MAWERFGGAQRVSYGDGVKAMLRQRRDGSSALTVTLSQLLVDAFETADRCEAYFGAGDDIGKIRIVFGTAGEVRETSTEVCEFLEKDSTSLTFRLPRAFGLKPPAPEPPPMRVAGEARRPGKEVEKLDAAAYLKKHGRKCEKLGDGTYAYEGEPRSPASVLQLVNHFRTKSGLNPLILADLA